MNDKVELPLTSLIAILFIIVATLVRGMAGWIVLFSFLLYFVCVFHKRKFKLDYDTEQAFKDAEKQFWFNIKHSKH